MTCNFFEQRHGSGCFKRVNGTVYDGQWTNDFMNGNGKMTYPNGDEYTGTWHQNKVGMSIFLLIEKTYSCMSLTFRISTLNDVLRIYIIASWQRPVNARPR